MFLNLLFVVLVECQEILIWIRVSRITEHIVEQYILKDFLLIDQIRLSIELEDVPNILMFEDNQQQYSIQIQDKIGQWVEIIAVKGIIQIDNEKFKIRIQQVVQFQFIQILRNYDNYFIEILKDEKYNNFILQNYEQQHLKTITFNTFISDSDAVVTLWFKFMIDYDTDNLIYFRYQKNQKFQRYQPLLLIESELMYISQYQKEGIYLRINGMIWNQIMIKLKENQIHIYITSKNGKMKEILNQQNLKNIPNKELVIDQQGLYVSHLSIQYIFKQYYCSPGCLNCLNNKCIACQSDQYLVDNYKQIMIITQCRCNKFYKSQNANGQCQMFSDLYEKQLTKLDQDIFNQNKCQFGYILVYDQNSENTKCIRCPILSNQLCDSCQEDLKMENEEILTCILRRGEQMYYKLEQGEYVPEIKPNPTYIIKEPNRHRQAYLRMLNQHLLAKVITQKVSSSFFKQFQYQCPYNCECQLNSQNQYYCMNLIDNKQYVQSRHMGIPLYLNSEMNIFSIEIKVINLKQDLIYIYNQQHYLQLEPIINNVDIDSIIIAGIHIIQIIIDLQIKYSFDQAICDLNKSLKFKEKINIIRQQHQITYGIPLIHLIIKSDIKQQIYFKESVTISDVDKLSLQDISIFSSNQEINLAAPIIILQNMHFKNIDISFYIVCDRLLIQNMLIENIVISRSRQSQNNLFNIVSRDTRLLNFLITNCTSDYYNIISFFVHSDQSQINQINLLVNKFMIFNSRFVNICIISINFEVEIDSLILVQNFILNNSNIQDTYIIYSNKAPLMKSLVNFFVYNSLVSVRLFSKLRMQIIDTFIISNCTFHNFKQVFKIEPHYQLDSNKGKLYLNNIILEQVISKHQDSLFSFNIPLNHIIFNESISIEIFNVSIKNCFMSKSTIFDIVNLSRMRLKLGFISLINVTINQFAFIQCNNLQMHYFIIQQSLIKRLFQIYSKTINIDMFLIKKMVDFEQIFDLTSEETNLTKMLFMDFQIKTIFKDQTVIGIQDDNYYGQIIIDQLKFYNNSFNNRMLNFLNAVCETSKVQLYNIVFMNNNISIQTQDLQRQSLVLIQSHFCSVINLFVYNLFVDQIFAPINAFDFNAYTFLYFQNIKMKKINLGNCNLFQLNSLSVFLQQLELKQIELYKSNAILISYQLNILLIDKFNFLQTKTDSPLFIIEPAQTISKIQINDFFIFQLQLESGTDVMQINTNIFIIVINGSQFRYIHGSQSSYLLSQNQQNQSIQSYLVSIQHIIIYKSTLGLANIRFCLDFVINNSKFIELQPYKSFLTSNITHSFYLSETLFSNLILSSGPLLDLGASYSIQNQIEYRFIIFFYNSIIQNVEYITNKNQSLIHIQRLILLTFVNTKIINNQCTNQSSQTCSLITILHFDQFFKIYFYNTLFYLNNFQALFQLERTDTSELKNLEGIDVIKQKDFVQSNQLKQKELYFYFYNQINMKKSEQPLRSHKFIKLKLNNYYLLEYLVLIKLKGNKNDININNNRNNEIVYLPSGYIFNQYTILELDRQIQKKYIDYFLFQQHDSDYINCSLNLIYYNSSSDSQYEKLQSYQIQINEDLSNGLQFNMDPYNKQYQYLLELICQNDVEIQQIQYRIKPFPCQMGEYYHNQQCKLCKIEYWYNTIQKNQNKCDQFDQQIVVEMKQGLLKLQTGYWRPNYHNKYFTQCELQQNCQGGWYIGDQSCQEGYLGAQCSECDIYNQRGSGSYSKLNGQCIQCSDEYNSLIIYVTVIFLYQLISTYLACNRSQKYIQDQKLMFQQSKYYNILNNLSVDQISILIKILQDVYIKIILINQLNLNLPDMINIPLNLIPTQLINKGLYCNIFHFGPYILLLELIFTFLFTLILIQVCYIIYIILIYKKTINQSITYLATICQYGYKQSYVYISYLLITQFIYVVVSNEHYLIGNQQYQYKQYKYVTFKIVLPIYLVYSIFVPILTILIMQYTKMRNNQQSIKIWAYFVQNLYSQGQFWEVYQLLQYSMLQVIFFYFYQQKQNQLILFTLAIFVDLAIQYKFKIQKLNKLNLIQFQTSLKVIALQALLCYYYQVSNQYLSPIIYGLIMIINFYILKPIIVNIISRLIIQYAHYTIKFQENLIIRFPKLISLQRKYGLGQNPTRAKENFRKLIKSLKVLQSDQTKSDQPIYKNSGPNNSLFIELETSKEIELINFR